MSKFSEARAKIDRWHFEADLSGFLSHDGSPLPRVAIRLNTKGEDNTAIIAAHKEVERMIAEADAKGTDAASDADLMVDMKTCQALWSAFREIGDADQNGNATYTYPAFPTADYMQSEFTADELACLLNLYTECRKRRGPLPHDPTGDVLDSLRESCMRYRHTEVPELPLIAYPLREDVTLVLCEVFAVWTDERKEAMDRIEELEDRLAGIGESQEHNGSAHEEGAGPA